MAHTSIGAAFDAVAEDYDVERRRLIPCFDAFYGHAVALVRDAVFELPAPRILDLGAGTGLFSNLLSTQLPHASFHLIDVSEKMIEQARQRFAEERSGRFIFELSNLATFEAPAETTYDAVVSALAIHHLTDEVKRRLYAQIRQSLTGSGLFVNAEQVLGPTVALEARYEREWRRGVVGAGATPAQIERAIERMAFDRCSTVEEQLSWLRIAGFSAVDCVFKEWRFAVLAAWA